jgi:transposase InsO family protein
MDLPESKGPHGEIYDSLLVLIDCFTKLVWYIPCRKTIDAPALAKLIWRIFLQSSTPASLVSDHGSVFTSEYWSTLYYHLRIQLRMSTTFHPQTDGQTECQNQELEAYLRMFVNYEQDNWVELLPTAEFAYNSKWNSSTKHSPIELAYGIRPIFPDGIPEDDWIANTPSGIEGQAPDPSY